MTRKQWGLRANELESAGLSWRDAEAQAFVEVWHQIHHASKTEPTRATSAAAEIAD